jgi:hypothetical protein
LDNRDIRKVRKRQHLYPEFGHTQGEILKKPAKKYISIQQGVKLRWFPEFHPCLSFFLSASTAATKIFTAPTCTATIIPLELCALNAEIQHFVMSFSISY